MTDRRRARDPVVPINQEVLRALLQERGWTKATLARRTGDLEQTIAHIVNTPGARCKKSRRAKIARVLQIPQEMLSGENFPIPVGFMLPDGFEFRYSARTQLAASRLVARVRKALMRDVRLRPLDRKSPEVSYQPLEIAVLSTFSEIMMIGEWRKRFMALDPVEEERRGYTEPATIRPWENDIQGAAADSEGRVLWSVTAPRREKDPDHEAAILGIIRAMEHVFEPWFRGTARLNYRAIRDFVHLPAHPFVASSEECDPYGPMAILPPAS